MEKFVKGDVVVVSFPFSDLTDVKRRPAFVLAGPHGNDFILCQITSQQVRDAHAISLGEGDFESGSLNAKSNIRPNRIFTADQSIILYRAAHLRLLKTNEIIESVVQVLRQS